MNLALGTSIFFNTALALILATSSAVALPVRGDFQTYSDCETIAGFAYWAINQRNRGQEYSWAKDATLVKGAYLYSLEEQNLLIYILTEAWSEPLSADTPYQGSVDFPNKIEQSCLSGGLDNYFYPGLTLKDYQELRELRGLK